MITKLRFWRQELWSSYWFVPTLIVLSALPASTPVTNVMRKDLLSLKGIMCASVLNQSKSRSNVIR